MPKPSLSLAEHQAIAERIRGLVGAQRQDLSAAAVRLGVDEVSLRASIDPDAPHLPLGVVLAIIREYAVDPMWLLSGEYDLATHRWAIAGNGDITGSDLRELSRGRTTPSGIPVVDLIPDDNLRTR